MTDIKIFAKQINKPIQEIIEQAKKLGFSISKDSMLTQNQLAMLYDCMQINCNQEEINKDLIINHSQKDRIFLQECMQTMPKFEFNALVASVFDDMLERSIPFYDEVMNLAIFFIHKHIQTNIKEKDKIPIIYDIGSSTGNLLLKLSTMLQKNNIKANLYGIDNAEAMVERARLKSMAMGFDIKFLQADFLTIEFVKADIFLAFYTIQFVRPLQRQNMIQKIYDSLCDNGVFLFAEKVISQDSTLEGQMIDCYYDYKTKQGYTHTEIYKKREALENVLIPYSVDENYSMLHTVGFRHVEILFKWVNFTLFIAKK